MFFRLLPRRHATTFIDAGNARIPAACAEPLEPRQLFSAAIGAIPAAAADEPLGTLAPIVFATLPAAAISGAKVKGASALVTITNVAPDDYNGPVTVTLFASLDSTLTTDSDPQITSLSKNVKIPSAGSLSVKVKIAALPSVPDGDYLVIAQVSSPTAGVGVNATDDPVTIAAPFIDLSGTFAALPTAITTGKRAKATITVANSGNTTAKGSIPITIATSPNADGSASTTFATVNAKLSIKPGGTKAVKLNFIVPTGTAAGSYFVVATLDPGNVLAEKSEANNTVLSGTALAIS